ncbi:hypothetical protein [Paenibacillus sp. 481]|uniref:hypothetical protein n=1 Tax=Paenibacillus sp. 481 TaxID=2835869 RepID=UPI001E48839F|nr:hypothetical protein [Paenibacillus sp. 481]UHA75003.1 hypothetical protein KIK04_08235 [Paenibacillus sp. 481]
MLSKLVKDSWMLVRTDISRFRYGFLLTLVFTLYMSGIAAIGFFGVNRSEEHFSVIKWTFDFTVLLALPSFGFFFSSRSTRFMKEDTYTKWNMKLRTLPISLQTIVTARIMHFFLALAVNFTLFFGVQYTIQILGADYFNNELVFTLNNSATVLLILLAYSIVTGTMYITMEVSKQGKTYAWFTWGYMVVISIVTGVISYSGGSILASIMVVANQYAWIGGVIALIVSVLAVGLGYKTMFRALRRRDFV